MPSPSVAARIPIERLAELAGVDTAERAYQLLRLGRSNGHPETTTVDPQRVAVVAVLARLEAVMLADPRLLEHAARLLHDAASHAGLIGLPRSLVVPVESVSSPTRKVPPPVLSTRANVGALLAGRSGFVVDLGSIAADWRS